MDKETGQLTIKSQSGVAWVGFWVDSNVYTFEDFTPKKVKKKIVYSKKRLDELMKDKPLKTITALSTNGTPARYAVP